MDLRVGTRGITAGVALDDWNGRLSTPYSGNDREAYRLRPLGDLARTLSFHKPYHQPLSRDLPAGSASRFLGPR